jgi:diadenosine tetraphosphate (Ap4A) HIT family hydrolase
MYPHVHLIPRSAGDVEDPVGGVRNVIPGRGNYQKSINLLVDEEKFQ